MQTDRVFTTVANKAVKWRRQIKVKCRVTVQTLQNLLDTELLISVRTRHLVQVSSSIAVRFAVRFAICCCFAKLPCPVDENVFLCDAGDFEMVNPACANCVVKGETSVLKHVMNFQKTLKASNLQHSAFSLYPFVVFHKQESLNMSHFCRWRFLCRSTKQSKYAKCCYEWWEVSQTERSEQLCNEGKVYIFVTYLCMICKNDHQNQIFAKMHKKAFAQTPGNRGTELRYSRSEHWLLPSDNAHKLAIPIPPNASQANKLEAENAFSSLLLWTSEYNENKRILKRWELWLLLPAMNCSNLWPTGLQEHQLLRWAVWSVWSHPRDETDFLVHWWVDFVIISCDRADIVFVASFCLWKQLVLV